MEHRGSAHGELEPKPAALLGQTVAFTGRFATLSRRQAEALVAKAGGRMSGSVSARVTLLVVGMAGWPLLESGRITRKLQDAERLRASDGRLRIVSEPVFRELLGLDGAASIESKTLDIAQVAGALGIERKTLERWEHLGLVQSHDGRYDFRDLVSLRTVTGLVSRGVSPVVIRNSLKALGGLLPGIDRPLAQLNILVSDTGRLVAELEDSLLTPSGQFELRFEAKPQRPAGPHPLAIELARAETRDSTSLVEEGLAHEKRGDLAGAERAYRRASTLAADDPAPHFNLGNVLMAGGRHEAAMEHFLQALALDPLHARAWFNLAHAQDVLGRPGAAVRSLRRAIDADPAFADAHFNLADLAERTGDRELARAQWQKYLRLDPSSPWAAQARRRLEALRRPAWA